MHSKLVGYWRAVIEAYAGVEDGLVQTDNRQKVANVNHMERMNEPADISLFFWFLLIRAIAIVLNFLELLSPYKNKNNCSNQPKTLSVGHR